MSGLEYSVVIPFYNEGENVAALISEIHVVMAVLGTPYELIAVNDGSRDNTLDVLAAEAAKNPAVSVINFAKNSGQAAALLGGLQAARAPLVITLDGDGQNNPADIPLLLQQRGSADMIVGVRAGRQDNFLRRLMSRVGNGVRGAILGDGMRDSGCALKVFRREVIPAFIPIKTLYSFMPALALAAGFTVIQHPVHHRPRSAGTSNYNLGVFLWRPLIDLIGVCWFCRRRFVSGAPR